MYKRQTLSLDALLRLISQRFLSALSGSLWRISRLLVPTLALGICNTLGKGNRSGQTAAYLCFLLVDVYKRQAMASSIRQGMLKGLGIPAMALLLICVVVLAVDLLITATLTGQVRVTWSAFVMIPCGIISAMLWLVHRNRALRSELKRKLHL